MKSLVEAAAHVPWQPLGRLLVDRGLVREHELERALERQAETGRRLGETLVELGYLSRTALTRALAAQYGLELTAERGFGTGLRAELERRHDGEADWEVEPRAAPGADEPAAAARAEGSAYESPELARLEEQWALLAAADARLAEAERELAALRETDRRRREQVRRLLERVRGLHERIGEHEPRRHAAAAGHVVLVQLAQRYELVEREGPVPEPGSPLELPEVGEGTWLAGVAGRSPFPNDPRLCVLAQPLAPGQSATTADLPSSAPARSSATTAA